MRKYSFNTQEIVYPEYLENEDLTLVYLSRDLDRNIVETVHFSQINILLGIDNDYTLSSYFNLVYKEFPGKEELLKDIQNIKSELLVYNTEHIKSFVCGILLESILHEFNNPITSISLNSQFLMEVIEYDEAIDRDNFYKILDMMNKSLLEASSITKGFVNFSRMEHIENDLFNLKEEINLAASFIISFIRKKRVDLFVDVKDALIFANKVDFTLILLLTLLAITNGNTEKREIRISNDEDRILITYPNSPVHSVLDLADNSFLQKKHFISIFSFILDKNAFAFEFGNDTISITFQKNSAES